MATLGIILSGFWSRRRLGVGWRVWVVLGKKKKVAHGVRSYGIQCPCLPGGSW
ncbi:hypothetical protein GCM10007392_46630 [Saccharospirillum salsuginis]|uniref:Uncharacterized protein n=1 Tax=Saccharospirillum salsuginis TaxID=418750 RepID=A0A918KS17_9GAMM|nr:hypothetical protein GCM10007392_46630 [Saccharospirillum salsuginis]